MFFKYTNELCGFDFLSYFCIALVHRPFIWLMIKREYGVSP